MTKLGATLFFSFLRVFSQPFRYLTAVSRATRPLSKEGGGIQRCCNSTASVHIFQKTGRSVVKKPHIFYLTFRAVCGILGAAKERARRERIYAPRLKHHTIAVICKGAARPSVLFSSLS